MRNLELLGSFFFCDENVRAGAVPVFGLTGHGLVTTLTCPLLEALHRMPEGDQ